MGQMLTPILVELDDEGKVVLETAVFLGPWFKTREFEWEDADGNDFDAEQDLAYAALPPRSEITRWACKLAAQGTPYSHACFRWDDKVATNGNIMLLCDGRSLERLIEAAPHDDKNLPRMLEHTVGGGFVLLVNGY